MSKLSEEALDDFEGRLSGKLKLAGTINKLACESADYFTTRLASVISDNSGDMDPLETTQLRLDALTAFQREVDTRIEGLKLQSKKRWNSLQLMHRLPTEIFAQILLNTRTNQYQPLPFLTVNPTENYNLALVSTHWRDVIFGTPAFWPSIDLQHPKELQELILRRNAHAAISVRCDQEEPHLLHDDTERFMDHFKTNPRRVESLNFGGHLQMSSWDIILPFLPTVKDLLIDDCGGEDDVMRSRFLIPGNTALRHVVLRNISLDWHSGRLFQLHSLCLCGVPVLPSKTRFHTLLSASPQLELLMLEDYSDQDEEPAGNLPTSPILLPELKSLVFYSTPIDLNGYILSKVVAPLCRCVQCRDIPLNAFIDAAAPFRTIILDLFTSLNAEDVDLTLLLEELLDEEVDDWLYFTLENNSMNHYMEWERFRYTERMPEIFIGCPFPLAEWGRLFQTFDPIIEKITTLSLGGRCLVEDFTSKHMPPFAVWERLQSISVLVIRQLDFTDIVNFKPIMHYISELRTLPSQVYCLPFPRLDTVSLLVPSTATVPEDYVVTLLKALTRRNKHAKYWGLLPVTRIRVSKWIAHYLDDDIRADAFTVERVGNPWERD